MSKITKLLFSVSEQGNPVARLWLDEADTTKNSEAIVLGIRSQVAYAFFLNVGADVESNI
jgi:predicted transposase YdaD